MKIRRFLNKQHLQKTIYIYLYHVFIQKHINNSLFKNNHTIILWNVLQVIGFKNSSGDFA